jgi:DivIVA domain-containing protein
MALNPQRIRDTRFKTAKRGGYDPAEVDAFLDQAAAALEAAQNDATAMEARARAAVARLQELSQGGGGDPGGAPRASADEAETISRTLLLAQRTADETIAEAKAEADRVRVSAGEEATGIVDEARIEARRAGEEARVQVEGEVQALLARRDFLESDVDHLEQYLVAQRERIVEAVSELSDLVQRVPNGLGDMRRPLLSAAAEEDAAPAVPDDELAEITRVADGGDGGGADEAGSAGDAPTPSGGVAADDDGGPPTMQMDLPAGRGGEPT